MKPSFIAANRPFPGSVIDMHPISRHSFSNSYCATPAGLIAWKK
jgi:hypothetical protein